MHATLLTTGETGSAAESFKRTESLTGPTRSHDRAHPNHTPLQLLARYGYVPVMLLGLNGAGIAARRRRCPSPAG
ncbi:hypothetical protein ACWEK5_46045 [Rhodococcus koreensis]